MASLSVDDANAHKSKQCTSQILSQLENIVSFPATDSSSFPSSLCEEFRGLIQHLPQGESRHAATHWLYSSGKFSLTPHAFVMCSAKSQSYAD